MASRTGACVIFASALAMRDAQQGNLQQIESSAGRVMRSAPLWLNESRNYKVKGLTRLKPPAKPANQEPIQLCC
jgi:hypothetical protein